MPSELSHHIAPGLLYIIQTLFKLFFLITILMSKRKTFESPKLILI
uniref:Uncharacterized protein n=1 Tax=Anguilla anguilla TaxID=7936 RepID=A0A0E9Q976_ANGAN